MLASALVWFFLTQAPGDTTWARAGTFDSPNVCEVWRLNFLASHPNMQAQACQSEPKKLVPGETRL